MGYFSFGPDGQKLFDAYPYGGLAEYLTAPQRNLVKLPDPVSFEEGARFGYLGTGYSALKKAGAGPGTTVLVDGISGTLGLGVALNALAMGVTKIFGTGRNADLLRDVKAIAPDRIEVLAIGETDLADWVRAHNGGQGVDIVIDALGPGAPAETLQHALDALARGGVHPQDCAVHRRGERPGRLLGRRGGEALELAQARVAERAVDVDEPALALAVACDAVAAAYAVCL
jgi:alcohol dehydrogenase